MIMHDIPPDDPRDFQWRIGIAHDNGSTEYVAWFDSEDDANDAFRMRAARSTLWDTRGVVDPPRFGLGRL